MATKDIAEHLRDLRAQAGNPSVRDLERLTANLGNPHSMSRSTIQDKLSGRNAPRLWQVVALVRACAEYARSIGTPLSPKQVDEDLWRSRLIVSPAQTIYAQPNEPAEASSMRAVNSSTVTAVQWDLNPLVRAEMHDMLELIRTNEGTHIAEWLPELIDSLEKAEMSTGQFLQTVSMQSANEIVAMLIAMAIRQTDRSVKHLLFLCAAQRPPNSLPAIIVQLRRSGALPAPTLATSLLEELCGRSVLACRKDLPELLQSMKAATLFKDSAKLRMAIGSNAPAGKISTVLSALDDEHEVKQVLHAVASGGAWHIANTLKALQGRRIVTMEYPKVLDEVIFGIKFGEHENVAPYLERAGLLIEAERTISLKDEPPF